MGEASTLLRRLPAVERILGTDEARALARRYGSGYLAGAARRLVGDWRERALAGKLDGGALEALASRAGAELERLVATELRPRPERVVNATGVIVHTNLGRAPWPRLAAERAFEAATRHTALEYDLETGERGSRESLLDKARLLFACDVLCVNNCAAAVLLALNSLAEGREVIVSRGELVEIGGSFRIPDVLAKSGARLVEVGTTNRTKLADYAAAIGPDTAAILKVHPSNYRIVGFTASVPANELVALARARSIPVVEDMGSGLIEDLTPHGITDEPPVNASIAAGVDVVTFSGDKLLGGPQAGLAAGNPHFLKAMRQNPLYRALRADKVTLAALDACFEVYLSGRPFEDIPVLRQIATSTAELAARASKLAAEAALLPGLKVGLRSGQAAVGGGAAPQARLPGPVIGLATERGAQAFEERLRRGRPPVIVRVEGGEVLIDLRSVAPDEDGVILAALAAALA